MLLTLETDKVAAEVTSEFNGVLASIASGEGEDVVIGAVVGQITEGAAAAAPAPAPAPRQSGRADRCRRAQGVISSWRR